MTRQRRRGKRCDTPTIPIAQNSATGTPQQSSRAAGGSAHPFSFFLIIFHVPRHNPKGGLIPPLGIYIFSLKNLCEAPLAAKHIKVVYLK
jgi:hypothetical protein